MTAHDDDLPDGEYEAVVDRFEDDQAVLEVATDDEPRQLVVDRTALPTDARHADAILTVTIESSSLTDAVYDAAATRERAQSAQDRFDRLSGRLGSTDQDDDTDGTG